VLEAGLTWNGEDPLDGHRVQCSGADSAAEVGRGVRQRRRKSELEKRPQGLSPRDEPKIREIPLAHSFSLTRNKFLFMRSSAVKKVTCNYCIVQ